ncbi:MAG TPA: hypothetical protein VFE71_05045, partial [Bacteroidales bacterium]|nr:hypothetical protein [Bacteroidales bacterium]
IIIVVIKESFRIAHFEKRSKCYISPKQKQIELVYEKSGYPPVPFFDNKYERTKIQIKLGIA